MEKSLIVAFAGGLGNQMFQYALYRRLKKDGRQVKCVITNDSDGPMPFSLDIFPSVSIDVVESSLFYERKKEYENRSFLKKVIGKIMPWKKEFYFENENKVFDNNPFKMEKGIIYGYFQGVNYVDPIRDELLEAFRFPEGERKLIDLIRTLPPDAVSIHIRRGDYLELSNKFGGICTKRYYEKAMDYMKKLGYENFVFFSNDISWVKDNFKLKNAIYIEKTMFEEYQDWYDMSIMSRCSHNIIANSTFSWWGAWLNNNPDKVVISPPYFDNEHKNKQMVEKDWIIISG
ncbi:Glycosyl transferase family 11 [Oribacterium sp. KHPX15]|uniref:alpha-1,2-fucosyltransferase n=1 Tax=Oribacterium sp. KHPX15 TaxID=1855342 RepID=UPI000898C0CD|nr:alpha-1,2-fucosyltransferase [Oribacterium sp. KHPX15]SEA56503.1 Glycosyl transferase family 11 [Oribacterium sp. KHPX15]